MMIYHGKNSDDISLNMGDVALTINAIQFYCVYTIIEHPNLKSHLSLYRHTRNLLNDALTKHKPLSVSSNDTVRSVKALECMKNHFDLFKIMCKEQGNVSRDDVSAMKKHLPKVLKNMKSYSAECVADDTTPDMIHKQLLHECSMAQHGFVREALDDMFKNFSINYQDATMHPHDLISAFALNGNAKFGLNNGKEFHILDNIITGTKAHIQHANLSNTDFSIYMNQLNTLLGAKKNGLKYVVLDSKFTPHKVSISDFKKIAKNTWHFCEENVEPEYRNNF